MIDTRLGNVRVVREKHNLMLSIPFKHVDGGVTTGLVPNYRDQVFSHRDTEGVFRHFHINTMKKILRHDRYGAVERIKVGIEMEDVMFIMNNHGIEKAHLERLTRFEIATAGIAVLFPDGSTLIVDGNHRMVRRYQLGKRDMWLSRFTMEQAMPCLLDMPDLYGESLFDPAKGVELVAAVHAAADRVAKESV